MKKVIGLDFGTDSVRALLVEETGRILATSVSLYSRWAKGLYCVPSKNIFRQHPLDYLESMEYVIKDVLKEQDTSNVVGIAIDTTGSTPCAVDCNGVPLALSPEFSDNPDAMFLLWKDHSSQKEADRINDVAQSWDGIDYRKYEGGIYSSEWFWSKLLHVLRSSPAIRTKAASFVEHCDWICGALTGNTEPDKLVRSRCAAGHKALWHPDWNGLPPQEFLSAIDPLLDGWREKLYTHTFTADHPVGKITPEWAEKLGLNESVVIGGSGFDAHFGAVGAQIAPYEVVKVVGTSTCDILVVPGFKKCVHGICGQVDGSVVPGQLGLEAGQSAFGDVYAWFRKLLSWGGEISLQKLEQEAAEIPPGTTGIRAVDWFNGRRTPDANNSLTGAILGLNLGSTAPMIYRSLVESTVFGARAIVERFREEGIPVNGITAVGGISKKSPFVMQMMADVLNVPIKISACDQTCALGSAMFAAVAAGIYPDIETAMSRMGAGNSMIYAPNKNLVPIYEKLYKSYLQTCKTAEIEAQQSCSIH